MITFGAMVEYHPISPRDQATLHQCGEEVIPGIFLDYEQVVERNWKGYILIVDLDDLEKLDASKIFVLEESTQRKY